MHFNFISSSPFGNFVTHLLQAAGDVFLNLTEDEITFLLKI